MAFLTIGFLLLSISIFCVESQSEVELEGMLERIFSPNEPASIHAQALRRDIMRRLYDALEREDLEEDLMDYKRSIHSLAKWDNLPGKRNLASLARGGYIRTLPEEDKRSIANLAKNGQLPHTQNNDEKRGIESLARNGELHPKREIEELIEELYNKRNIGSIARSYSYPYGKRFIGSLARSGDLARFYDDKRNIAALARDGIRPYGKRNVAALLRQDKIHGPDDRSYEEQREVNEEKKNIASIKAGYGKNFKRSVPSEEAKGRKKRQSDYYEINDEYASPVFQNQNVYDYEELIKALTGEYPDTEKRFLGRLPQMGKSKTTPSPKTRYQ